MGRLRRGRRPTKRNNIKSKTQKLLWNNRSQKEPMIFEDILLETEVEVPEIDETTPEERLNDEESEESSSNERSNEETFINVTMVNKKYDAEMFIRKRPSKAFEYMSFLEYERINNYPLEIEKEPKEEPITGNRIVELSHVLTQSVKLQFDHSKVCEGQIKIKKENRSAKGLVSTVCFDCTKCAELFYLDTEDPAREKSNINVGAVWGTLATGSTYGHLDELLSCMDIPSMPSDMFYKMENDLGQEWKAALWKSMKEAGEREKEYAISKGHLCLDGTPYITVYVDGSWSKRSYGTNFNSLSGMVGIIGRHTGELLFAAVRNKFCAVCQRAENKSKEVDPHVCFKNWNESAPAMESDMVVEGFNSSISMHGVKYCKFVGDGDSSVFAKIKQSVTYGYEVKKIECTNHALKNYGKHLRKIKADTSIEIRGRKLLKESTIKLLTKRAKCSIYEHSRSEEKNLIQLKEDLQNGLNHVYGDHSNCRAGICNTVGDQNYSKIAQLKSTSIYNHLYGALQLLVRKAHLLIENENNNRAERLMNIVARFNMGKRLNLIQRGSYERRVTLSGMRHNKSFAWHSSPWKQVMGKSPGKHFKKYMEKRMQERKTRKSSVCKQLFATDNDGEQPRENKNKKELKKTHQNRNVDYGPNAEQAEEEPEIISMESELLLKRLQVSTEERNDIQRNTVEQFNSDLYKQERRYRLTASLFGTVLKRRPQTPCHNIVKSCLVNSNLHTDAIDYGIAKESVAIQHFENKMKLKVQRSGLWIDLEYGFLGASPDGLVGDDSILEVKCIFFKPEEQVNSLEEAIARRKSQICLEKKLNEIKLKRNHSYYYQIQGQLNITNKSKCYFVVYIHDKIDLWVEEIRRDEELWKNKMLPELTRFYKECIAPEITRGNIIKQKKCVDPPYILEAITLFNTKKKEKEKKKKK